MGMIGHWCWPTSQQLQNVSISSILILVYLFLTSYCHFYFWKTLPTNTKGKKVRNLKKCCKVAMGQKAVLEGMDLLRLTPNLFLFSPWCDMEDLWFQLHATSWSFSSPLAKMLTLLLLESFIIYVEELSIIPLLVIFIANSLFVFSGHLLAMVFHL